MKKDKGMVTCGYRGVCNTLHTGDTAGNREFLSKTLRLIGEHPCRSRHSAYCWPRCPCLRFSRLWSRVCFRAFQFLIRPGLRLLRTATNQKFANCMVKRFVQTTLDQASEHSFLPLFSKINRFALQTIFRRIGNRTNTAKMPVRL